MIFEQGQVDTSFFRKSYKKDFILVHIDVHDIKFGEINEKMCEEFYKLMSNESEMSMMGELKFFLGIHIKKNSEGIYIHLTMYAKELQKKLKCKSAD